MKMISALVVFCIIAAASAQGRPAYICEVLLNNFCPTNAATCAHDPVLNFGSADYGFENFNLVSFDGMYAPSGDVEGRTAVRNSVDLTAYSIGYQLRTSGVAANSPSLPYTMVVGRNAKWHGGSVHPDGSGFPYAGPKEYIFVGSDFTNADSFLQTDRTGSCPTAGCLNADFDAAQAYYKDLSAAFATIADNAHYTIASWGTISLTCNSMADSQYYITVSPNDFSTINFWDVTGCNSASGLVVNIKGAGNTVKFFGASQTFFSPAKTLYNVVPTASTPSVRVEVGTNGNLLAPDSNYNQPGLGVFVGQVIVANVQQVLQINLVPCAPQPSNNHNNSNNYLCPSWEADCAGLDLVLDDSTYSFRDINVISFGDFTADTGDIQGRLAVQGNAHFGYGYSVGYELQTAVGIPDRHLPFSLIVEGDLTWGSGALYPQGNGIPYPGLQENMFVGGTFSTNQTDLVARRTEDCAGDAGCLDDTFNSAKTCYTGYSNNIAAVADNVAKNIEWSGLSITCNDASATAYYVSLTSAEFGSFTYTTLGNCNYQAQWYINIRGTDDVSISGDSFPSVPGGTVYNVVGCGRTITVHDTQLSGSFLAPCSTLNQPNGVINGKVVAGNIAASLQINRENTCPQNITVTIPIVVQIPSIQSTQLTLTNNGGRTGDSLTADGPTIVATNGNVVSLSAPVTAAAGKTYYIQSNTYDSRTPVDTQPASSGASVVSMAFALVVALIALF